MEVTSIAPSNRSLLGMTGWMVLLFVSALGLFTRNNSFPYYYHPDEPGKVTQIQSGKWNFHHPLLMLRVAAKTAAATKTKTDLQTIAVTGRWVSAAMAALSIVLLTLLAYRCGGIPAAIGVGLSLLFHHQLFELSHYFKEDTTLLAGCALAFLACHRFCEKPGILSALFLGSACATAFSGKYIGAIVIPFALAAIIANPLTRRQVPLYAAFLVSFLAVAAFINFPAFKHLAVFNQSFDRELGMVVHGQEGMTRRVPHMQYWNVFRDNTTPAAWVCILFYAAAFLRSRARRSLPEWILFLFPFVFAVMLSFSPKSNDRYFLPATAFFYLLAVLGTMEAAAFIAQRPGISRWLTKTTATTGALLLLILAQLPSFIHNWQAFKHDDRAELRAWVEANLPANAVILQDPRAGLPVTGKKAHARQQKPMAQKVLGKRYASDFGPFESLKAKGITHVAASESNYGRFFLKSLKPQEKYQTQYMSGQKFYSDLFDKGTLLWSRDRGAVIYLHPGVRLYQLQ